MIDALTSFVDWLLGPGRPFLAVVLGLIISWGVTQLIKTHWDLSRRSTTLTALAIGTGFTYLLYPGWGEFAFGVAFATGLAAPWLYKMLIAVGRARGWVWVDALSSTPSTKP